MYPRQTNGNKQFIFISHFLVKSLLKLFFFILLLLKKKKKMKKQRNYIRFSS